MAPGSNRSKRPGRATASAFAIGPRYEFTLTRADALAWLGLRREVTGWRKWVYILWFASAGIALSLLPEAWVGAQGDQKHWIAFALAFAVQFVLLMGFLALKRQWEAYRLLPASRPAWFQDRGDHLSGIAPDGTTLNLPPEMVGQIIETPTHLFFSTRGSVLILPASVFRHAQDKQALTTRWLAKVEALDA